LHNLLGLVEEKAGHIQPAADQYQRAAHMDPTEKHVFDLGQCFLRNRGAEQAIQIFTFGVGTYPASARMQVGLGVAHYARGEYDQAVEALCRGVDLDPSDTRALYFLGQMLDVSAVLAGEVTSRLAHFVDAYPSNAAANYYYALSLWKRTSQPDAQSAEKYFKKALDLDPKMADAHLQLGILYEDTERLRDAVREYELAVKLDPRNDKGHFRLARAYRAAGRNKQAEDQLRLYRELHSKPDTSH
jgi:tetratricopeptide (TPR) repeat protein